MIKYIIQKKYIFIFLIIFLFFIYGLMLSYIIDHVFPDYAEDSGNFKLIIEIIGEIGVAYMIYYILKAYSNQIIKYFFNYIKIDPPSYINIVVLIAFSTGIFKYLQKSTDKINFIKEQWSENK